MAGSLRRECAGGAGGVGAAGGRGRVATREQAGRERAASHSDESGRDQDLTLRHLRMWGRVLNLHRLGAIHGALGLTHGKLAVTN